MYYVFCIFECLRAPRKMGKCSLGLPSLKKDFIIRPIIIIIIISLIVLVKEISPFSPVQLPSLSSHYR